MIGLSPWMVQITALKRGETVRVNHHSCGAGQDTRKRLYLTRSASTPNIILGYCHNCQDKGFHTLNPTQEYKDFDPTNADTLPPQLSFAPPDNMTTKVKDWPTDAHKWRVNMRLDIWDCEAAGISYDPAMHRIYLPQWSGIHISYPDKGASLDGYQLRNLSDHGPKYLTAHRNRELTVSTLITNSRIPLKDNVPTVAVLVEDLASGIRVAKAMRGSYLLDIKVIVNYGTKVSPEVLHKHRECDVALVWLDNDSDHVRSQAEKIRNVWGMVSGKDTGVITQDKDPKHYTMALIHESIITGIKPYGQP